MPKEALAPERTRQIWIRANITVAVAVIIAVLVVTGTTPGTAFSQKDSSPRPQDKLVLGEDEVKQLLLLMDTDKNGKISKQEYMKFMEAEFEKLDKDKSGDLDVKELTHSQLRVSHFATAGK
jgi:hypothetical protein